MNMHEIHEYARRFLETHGAKAEAEAAKKDGILDRVGTILIASAAIPGVFPPVLIDGMLYAVVLRSPARFKWVPGLYWRVGRRIGVGGATHPSQAKAMAELLASLLIDR